jgi:4-hydroxyphenylacetaldehyde oxime monooxygenase
MLSYGFLDVVFSPYNDYWREMHKLFNLELLSMRRVQSFSDARATEVERLIKSIEISPPVTPINLSEKLYALNDGIIGTVAFGKMYGSAQFERSSFHLLMEETAHLLGNFTFKDFFRLRLPLHEIDSFSAASYFQWFGQ